MRIDINADVGEGIGNEEQLMPYLSSCNIACGGHAGDFETINTVVNLAIRNKVKIGGHPSYPDKESFGRQPMPSLSNEELLKSLKNQILKLVEVINANNASLHHIKPHGALYNLATTHIEVARVVVKAMTCVSKAVKLYVPFGSVIERLALQNNVPIAYEVFTDRNYNDDYTLVSRKNPKAVLTNPEAIFEHVYYMYTTQNIKTLTGNRLPIRADTYCVHGDNEKAIDIVNHLKNKLLEKGIIIDKL